MSNRVIVLCTVLLTLPLVLGCVYYNTFYHARQAAHEAELLRELRAPDAPPDSRELELLERAAEKCGRVLHLHPDSSWTDDALLLLGSTHYYQGRYESAEARLNEFLVAHPESELRPEAEYMLARVLVARGNPVSAEALLENLALAEPPVSLSDDALALIGEARHARRDYEGAARAYADAMERFPGSDRRAQVRFLAAQNYEAMGDLDEAAWHYELVPTERGARQLAFESRMRLAEVDLERGFEQEALDVLDDLEGRTDDRDDLDRVQLLRGRTLEAMGALEEAISTYEAISTSHKRSEASAEAHYRTGLIHRDRHELLDEAAESFKKAREEAPRTDVAKLAAGAAEDVTRLAAFLETREESEHEEVQGSPEPEGGPGTAGEVTGTAGHEAVAVDTASQPADAPADTLPQFSDAPADTASQPADAPADTASQPADALADTLPQFSDAPADTMSRLPFNTIDSMPEHPVAPVDSLRVSRGGPVDSLLALSGAPAHEERPETGGTAAAGDSTDAAPEVDPVALAHFRAAEIYLFRFEDHERAVRHYSAVIADHPDCTLAPKAALALAWILEERVGDIAGARESYEAVITDYPDTEFAEGAAKALERMSRSDSDE